VYKMSITDEEKKKLISEALKARNFAYTPYSHFRVGAALMSENWTIYRGCNIENGTYSPTNCAERTAFFKAVSEGVREFRAIAIVGGPEGELRPYCSPCGVCRQVMQEFCDGDFEIILGNSLEESKTYKLKELLPLGFDL